MYYAVNFGRHAQPFDIARTCCFWQSSHSRTIQLNLKDTRKNISFCFKFTILWAVSMDVWHMGHRVDTLITLGTMKGKTPLYVFATDTTDTDFLKNRFICSWSKHS